MTQIVELLRREESETLEFKESFGREAIETISAFANTKGGILFVGVNDEGVVVGVHSAKNALKDLANHISQATSASISLKKSPLPLFPKEWSPF